MFDICTPDEAVHHGWEHSDKTEAYLIVAKKHGKIVAKMHKKIVAKIRKKIVAKMDRKR